MSIKPSLAITTLSYKQYPLNFDFLHGNVLTIRSYPFLFLGDFKKPIRFS